MRMWMRVMVQEGGVVGVDNRQGRIEVGRDYNTFDVLLEWGI